MKQLGLSIDELDSLTPGMILDLFTERVNDEVTYDRVATQEDFDKF